MADRSRIFHAPEGGPAEAPAPDAEPAAAPGAELKARTIAEMSFSTHILSLNAMAQFHLGQLPGEVDLPLDLEVVAQVIDTLAMLQEKTRGNLDPVEAKLLDSLLYDLRVKHLAARS